MNANKYIDEMINELVSEAVREVNVDTEDRRKFDQVIRSMDDRLLLDKLMNDIATNEKTEAAMFGFQLGLAYVRKVGA